MEVRVRDIERLIELNKRKAELEFQKSVFGVEGGDEMREVNSDILDLLKKTKGIAITYPKQGKLDELGAKLRDFSAEQMKEALSSRSGDAYDLLQERGTIIKENYRNRLEVAKLSLTISMLSGDERKAVSDAIRSGRLGGSIKISSLNGSSLSNMARFLRRCGMPCDAKDGELVPAEGVDAEVRLEMQDRHVWVSQDAKEKLDENLGMMKGLTQKIQLINAQRYVKDFNEDEEKEFEELQNEYLRLLKEQDELLREFNAEGKFSVKA
jgi:hypothetical protein